MTDSKTDERAIIREARSGDTQAFGELVLRHQTFVYNLALRLLNDPYEAQDLAQEGFLRAWQSLGGFRQAASFRTWLYRIVVNLCYNRSPQLRRSLSQISLEQETDGEPAAERLPGSSPNPEQALEAQETRRFLHQQIEKLPPSYRLLVMLRYQQDLSYEEIAEVTGMPIGTVKTGLFRAHARLKAALLAGQTRPGNPEPVLSEPGNPERETPGRGLTESLRYV
jgi:RNA polymerase sigma-70 factor (ECF subfamily)